MLFIAVTAVTPRHVTPTKDKTNNRKLENETITTPTAPLAVKIVHEFYIFPLEVSNITEISTFT
jgi:hypothetical protein